MKIKLFIHLGMPKTGTTFLQNNIFDKLEINYFNKESVFGKLLYDFLINNNNNSYEFLIKFLESRDFNKKNILYSNETIWDCFFRNKIKVQVFLKRLNLLDIDIKTILVCRTSDSFLRSYYLEQIKWNNISPFKLKLFVNRKFDNFNFDIISDNNNFNKNFDYLISYDEIKSDIAKNFVTYLNRMGAIKNKSNVKFYGKNIRKSISYNKYIFCSLTNFLFSNKFSVFGKYRFKFLHLRNKLIDLI